MGTFWVELKLNLGACANCWDDEGCEVRCSKLKDDGGGFGVGFAGFDVMNRCGDGVYSSQMLK